MLGYFSAIFLLLISSLIPLCSEIHTLYILNSFKFFKVWFMTLGMVYLGRCSIWTEKNVFLLLLGEVFFKCQVQLVDSIVQLFYILDFLSIIYTTEKGVLMSLILIMDFSYFQLHQFLFTVFWSSVVVYTVRIVMASWWINSIYPQ